MSAFGDALALARMQFAFTMAFHIVFPAFTIGLASYLAMLEALWLRTGKDRYINLFKYWMKVFAVVFAMGVVSGLVMSYEFGTNWSAFSDKVGPVMGPLMAYEVMSAFFLEAGFLGVMLFGLNRVGKTLHFAATCAVAVGTFFSAFWILSANSWMQTPQGYGVNAAGQFVPLDWAAIIFNPSFPYRLAHMLLAAYLTTALVVGAVGAWHLMRDSKNLGARTMFAMAMGMVLVTAPIQIFAGDQHGLNTLEHQPAKIMAMEGHYESHPDGAPLILFGLPDDARQEMHAQIAIPHAGSLILKHDPDAAMDGLDTIAPQDRPPVSILFWSFRLMVGVGVAMLLLGVFAGVQRLRGKLWESKVLHLFAVAMGPMGFVAVLAGWVTTEVGRQPFTVYGVLRTGQSVGPVAAPAVAASLAAFAVVYFVVFAAGVLYVLRLVSHAPQPDEPELATSGPTRSAGITPAPAVEARGGKVESDRRQDKRPEEGR